MSQWRLWTRGDGARLTARAVADRLKALPTTTYEHGTGGKVPRNNTARSYALTVGARVLAATTLQLRRMRNCVEVAELIYAADDELDQDAVLREAFRFILTDAYRCSGGCALYMHRLLREQSAHSKNGVIGFVERCGIAPEYLAEGMLAADTGAQLYLAVTDLSSEAATVLRQLDDSEGVRPESTCYLVNSGIWTPSQMEGLLLASPLPHVVIQGGAAPPFRHLHQLAMRYAMIAVLAGKFEAFARSHWVRENGIAKSMPDNPWPVTIRVEKASGLRWLSTNEEEVPLDGWSAEGSFRLTSDTRLAVVVQPLRRREAELQWDALVQAVQRLTADAQQAGARAGLVVSADFNQLAGETKLARVNETKRAGISLFVAPQTFGHLSTEASQKLNFSRIMRR